MTSDPSAAPFADSDLGSTDTSTQQPTPSTDHVTLDRFLTGDVTIADIVNRVRTHSLPHDLVQIADRYDEIAGIRDRFLWKWFDQLNPHFRLPSVTDKHARKVQTDKTLLTFYITLIDDLIDVRGDKATFEEAAKLPFDPDAVAFDRDGVDEPYLQLTADVWSQFHDRLATSPTNAYEDELFYYDLRQAVNAIRYAHVVNQHPPIANLTEAYAYSSHNMVMFPYAGIDLLHSPDFDPDDLAALRNLLWHAQQMARIGNWVSTWERELDEADFSSGVVIYALEHDIITRDDLTNLDTTSQEAVEPVIDQISTQNVGRRLLDHWHDHYETIERDIDLASIDVETFLQGMETVLVYHLATRGVK